MQGSSNPLYQSRHWKKLRATALKRDGWRCVVCGVDLKQTGARVDHIRPVRTHPALALELTNLQSLCPRHDNLRHAEKGRGGLERPAIGEDGLPDSWR